MDQYVKVRLKKDHATVRTMTKRAAELLKGKWEIIGDYEEHPTFKKKEEDVAPVADNLMPSFTSTSTSDNIVFEVSDPLEESKQETTKPKRGRKPKAQ